MASEFDREGFLEEWQEFLEDTYEQMTLEAVEDVYEEILTENLENNSKTSNLPAETREALAEMGAKIYSEQAQRILDSSRVGEDELELAVATAFLDTRKQVKVGAQAQGLVDVYWDEIGSETPYSKDQVQQWTQQTLINPWPPHQLTDNWESVDRFKPGREDPTYQ